jgi:hypothetical protein
VIKHKGGYQGQWFWMLPEHEADWLAREERRDEQHTRRNARAKERAAEKRQQVEERSTPRRPAVSPSPAPSVTPSARVMENSPPPIEKRSGSFSAPVEEVNCFIGGDSRGRARNEKPSARAEGHEARLRDAAG